MSAEVLILYGLFCLAVLILLTVLGFLVYSGLFTDIVVGAGPPPVGKLYVAYKFGKGAYKDAGYLFTEAVSIVPELRSIGVYYDDPDEVAPGDQRYMVGTILAEGNQQPDPSHKEQYEKRGYKFHTFPAVTNVVKTAFPFKTNISILIAIKRVYPLLGQYVKERRLCAHPFAEIYDGFTIHFMAPLAKQDEFYVPETQQQQCHSQQEVTSHSKESPKHKKTTDQKEGGEIKPKVKSRRSKRSGSPSRSLDKTSELSAGEEDSGVTSANTSATSADADATMESEQSCGLDTTAGTSFASSDVTSCTENDSVVSGTVTGDSSAESTSSFEEINKDDI